MTKSDAAVYYYDTHTYMLCNANAHHSSLVSIFSIVCVVLKETSLNQLGILNIRSIFASSLFLLNPLAAFYLATYVGKLKP